MENEMRDYPWFKFTPNQWISGDITMCSLEAQGLFINICALYWRRDCELTRETILKKWDRAELLQELIDAEIMQIEGGQKEIENGSKKIEIGSKRDRIKIDFLIEQFNDRLTLGQINSKNAQKRYEKAEDRGVAVRNPCDTPATPLQYRIRDKSKKEDNTTTLKESLYSSFEIFWEKYDKKVGKKEALSQWMKLSPDEYSKIIDHVPGYVRSREKQFRKDPERYLKRRVWEDEVPGMKAEQKPEVSLRESMKNYFDEK